MNTLNNNNNKTTKIKFKKKVPKITFIVLHETHNFLDNDFIDSRVC